MREDPFRLRILKGLTSLIETVNPDNDYELDLRDAVFRGRILFGDDDPETMVSILEPPIPEDNVGSPARDNTETLVPWVLLLQGFVKDDPKHPSDPAHLLMADVKSVLVGEKKRDRGRNILGMAGRVDRMIIGQGSVRPADEFSSKCFFWLNLTLWLVEEQDT